MVYLGGSGSEGKRKSRDPGQDSLVQEPITFTTELTALDDDPPRERTESHLGHQVIRASFPPYSGPRGMDFHYGSKMRKPRLRTGSRLPKATQIVKLRVGDRQGRPVPTPDQYHMGNPRLPSVGKGLPEVTHQPSPGS